MHKKLSYEELEQRVRELEQAQYENNITEVFFNSLFEKHDAVMLLIEPDSGAIVEANIAAQNYYGYSINTLKQMSIQEINILTTEEIAEKRNQAANENTNYFEFPHRLSGGEIRTVEVHSSPIIVNKKKYLLSVINDITKRKYTENALLESEHKWRNILVNTPQIGISLDPKGRIVFANTHFLKLTGWELTDIVGKDWFDMFIPGKIKEEIRHVFLSTIHQMDALEFSNIENEIVTKSGAVRNVAWSNLVTKDFQGELVDVTCLGTDLTERKNYEILLEKKNTDLKLAQRIASIGVWTLDPEVAVPEWSDEIYRIHERDPHLGPYPLEEYKNIYKGEWFEIFNTAIQSAITDGTPYDIELKLEFSTGKEKWIHAICEPEPETGPKGHKVRGTIQDITEKKKVEEALRQSHKMEAIGTLAGGIAHEFNNMLYVIIGNTELALEDIPEWDLTADCIQEIRTASLRAKDVVRKLLSVARKTPEARKLIQVRAIVDESLGLLRKTIPTSIEIISDLSCTTETILADPTEISQVLMNLCTNSAHAMVVEKGVLEVTLETKTLNAGSSEGFEDIGPGDYVKLTVSDDGKGIAPDILDRIFDPYFTTKDVDEGLGMGLAVVQGIVKKHKGAIKVESEVGKGTAVDVLFPLIDEQPAPSSKKIETLPKGIERILFVDDEAALVKMVTQILSHAGYEVIGKTTGLEALRVFKDNPERFDLVITDIAMPEMVGDLLVNELIQVRPNIPIILCTGHSDRIDENRAMKLGIKEFVMKPLTKSDLTKTVRKVLDGAKG